MRTLRSRLFRLLTSGVTCAARWRVGLAAVAGIGCSVAAAAEAALTLSPPMPAPTWARLQRELLAVQPAVCREFYQKYFDDRGYLQCFVRWGANDGPDDAF